MDKVVELTLLNTLTNLAAIMCKGLNKGFNLSSLSFKVHNERLVKRLKAEGLQCREGSPVT